MRRDERVRAWTGLLESTKDMRLDESNFNRAEYESLASRLRVQEAHDRWVYWTRLVYEKAARVPVREEIWDEDVIPLRQPIEECE